MPMALQAVVKRPMKNFSKRAGKSSAKYSRTRSEKHKQVLRLRSQIAVKAARLMSEEGTDNLFYARKKAAQQLGVQNEHSLPDNEDILAELKIYQSLYNPDIRENLQKLRATALKAMQLFQDFQPRLTGSVLLGYAGVHSGIDIQLMSEPPEQIATVLMDHHIPYQLGEWKLFFSKQHPQQVPCYQFYAGEYRINLIILSEKQRRITPLNTLNGQSMQRASIAQVQALLNPAS